MTIDDIEITSDGVYNNDGAITVYLTSKEKEDINTIAKDTGEKVNNLRKELIMRKLKKSREEGETNAQID